MEICSKDKCAGCSACSLKCPQNAIEMREDGVRGLVAVVNGELCAHCGLCGETCPANNAPRKNKPKKVYAAWAKDGEVLEKASSGGMATVLAKYIIGLGGAVYGVAQAEDYSFRFVRITKEEELRKITGSKYVQSITGDVFERVKNDLDGGARVLFVGSGCQVAGLKKYLSKDYENLTAVDLICHGMPCPDYLRQHICAVCPEADYDSAKISFRDGNNLQLTVSDGEKTVYKKPFYKDSYYLGFELGLLMKESCYSCDYATVERVGDITLGDFHGLGSAIKTERDTAKGSSMVLLNTEAGERILSEIDGLIVKEEHTADEALSANPQLSHPAKKHARRGEFEEAYPKYGFEKAARGCLKKDKSKYTLINTLTRFKVVKKAIAKIKK